MVWPPWPTEYKVATHRLRAQLGSPWPLAIACRLVVGTPDRASSCLTDPSPYRAHVASLHGPFVVLLEQVTEVAVRHGVYPGLLFSWRRQVRDGVLAAAPPATFVPVRMLEPAQELSSEMVPAPKEVRTIASKPGRPAEPIEITLSNGCQLRIDPRVDARALRRIVDVLRG